MQASREAITSAVPYGGGTMKQENIIIRRETPADYAAVEYLTREAFWNV